MTEEDLLEKTYSTLSASNIVLQQQYKAQKFTKFSDLIYVLLLAEKQNQLLMKNHQAQPTGATVVPEAYYSTNQRPKLQKGVVMAARSHPAKVNKVKAHLREETKPRSAQTKAPNCKTPKTMDANMYYQCGSNDHWSRVYRAPKKVVDEYHSRRKKFESNFMQVDEPKTTKMEVFDFQKDTTIMED